MELHRQQSPSLSFEVVAAGRGSRGRESLAILFSPLLSAPPCAPSWPPQRWSRVRVNPEGRDQVRPGEQRTPPPQSPAVG